jgi:hypothetical protein
MNFKFFLSCALLAIMLSGTSGCYSTADGNKRTGMPFLKDSVVGRYERPLDQIYEAAVEVLRFNGTVVSENRINNSLTARVDNNTVWVRVQEESSTITQLEVQARGRWGGPDVDLASEMEKQIALQLR